MPLTFPDSPDGTLNIHASCVCVQGRGVLICGATGSGKSALALHLMALGADLVADDRTIVTKTGDVLTATAPAAIRAMIEARGIGILNARATQAAVHLCVDLDTTEAERLPPLRSVSVLGHAIPLLHRVPYDHFGAAILQILKHGRHS
ncbi:HPr kinase/phosphorylase [Octadecabacter sp. R77987]|uniref:HPr kinase/phosphorylase n=1 Tax=Octadecabacter sp. R77987 TaxID=3093874 RepID=UPI00366E7B23